MCDIIDHITSAMYNDVSFVKGVVLYILQWSCF